MAEVVVVRDVVVKRRGPVVTWLLLSFCRSSDAMALSCEVVRLCSWPLVKACVCAVVRAWMAAVDKPATVVTFSAAMSAVSILLNWLTRPLTWLADRPANWVVVRAWMRSLASAWAFTAVRRRSRSVVCASS